MFASVPRSITSHKVHALVVKIKGNNAHLDEEGLRQSPVPSRFAGHRYAAAALQLVARVTIVQRARGGRGEHLETNYLDYYFNV